MVREEKISNRMDWITVLLYGIIVFWGWLNIFSVTYEENQFILDPSINSGRQLIFIASSIAIIMFILIMDMRFYETFAWVIYGVILFLCLIVVFTGHEVGGNQAWLRIGSFGFQPSEFAKFATALAVAKFIGTVGFRMDHMRNQVKLFAIIGLPMAIILLQKDTGTALVFTAFVLVFYREGMSPFLIHFHSYAAGGKRIHPLCNHWLRVADVDPSRQKEAQTHHGTHRDGADAHRHDQKR